MVAANGAGGDPHTPSAGPQGRHQQGKGGTHHASSRVCRPSRAARARLRHRTAQSEGPHPLKLSQRGWFELTEAIMHTKFSQFSTKNTPLHHPSILAPFCRVRMGPRDHSMGTADLHGSILLWWVAYF